MGKIVERARSTNRNTYMLLFSYKYIMDIIMLQRKEDSSLEDDVDRLNSTMKHFGLKLAISKDLPGQYRELLYETEDRGGIMAQYRLDDAPKLQVIISDVPSEQVPKTVEVDNGLYSIGMSTELFNSICAHLQR